MSIPSTLISCFIGLVSCGYMSSLIVNSLWLIAVDPHRGGSISLRPIDTTRGYVMQQRSKERHTVGVGIKRDKLNSSAKMFSAPMHQRTASAPAHPRTTDPA